MGKSVLLVDGNDLARNVIWDMLNFHNPPFKKQMAGNGVEALRMMKSGFIPNIIICDVSMPVMSGIALFNALAQSDHKIRWLFTAASFNYQIRKFFYRVNETVLTKPFRIKELEKALEKILAEE